MSSKQAYPVISTAHIIDNKIISDEVHRIFSKEFPGLLDTNNLRVYRGFALSLLKSSTRLPPVASTLTG